MRCTPFENTTIQWIRTKKMRGRQHAYIVGKNGLILWNQHFRLTVFWHNNWPGGSWKGTVRPSCGPAPSGLCSLELRESRTLNSMDFRKLLHLFSNITDTTTWLPSCRFPWMSYTLMGGEMLSLSMSLFTCTWNYCFSGDIRVKSFNSQTV